ncbi:hypothetical protein ND321_001659 [Campylobacter coli]|nr:hypothetical protein [Campylobacter coli]
MLERLIEIIGLFIFLAKSEEKNNIELLIKEYRKEQRKIGFFKRFFL